MKKTIRLDSSFADRDRLMLATAQLMPGFLFLNKKSDERAEVFIYGDIGGYWDGLTAEQFCKDLAVLDTDNIDVRINSGGGLISDGIAIMNGLARHKAKVTMHIEGMAASIASVIPMAGDEIVIYEGARVMIHKPWSFAMGNDDDMHKEGDVLTAFGDDILDLYESRTEQTRADLAKWMADETWMSAREAVERGFADRMEDAKKKPKAAHSAMMKLYRHVPTDMLGIELVTVRELEDILHGGGFSNSQAKVMASSAMNKITGNCQRDAVTLPQRDAGEVGQTLTSFIDQVINHIR